ncbi:MAG: hypothetical protein HWE10_05910 [Gammaproteobacteria bacterium]|nr:hypothetical protein [Gammaproteobacteria bacterium]
MKLTSKELLDKFLIELKGYNKKQLRNLFLNGLKQTEAGRFEEGHFEELADAIEMEMRERYKTEAKKLFGGLSDKPRAFLKELIKRLSEQYDISDNKHKSKVKNGAGVFKGDKQIDVYISYKKSKSTWFGIYIRQVTAKDPIMMLSKYRSDKTNETADIEWSECLLEQS